MATNILIAEVDWAQQHARLSAIRRTVFIEEQHVPENLEWDGIDADCRHVLAQDTSRKIAIGTGRLVADGQIGRMAILSHYRGRGIGSGILRQLIELARRDGHRLIYIHSQLTAVNFYQKANFKVSGNTFIDAGIAHVKMTRSC